MLCLHCCLDIFILYHALSHELSGAAGNFTYTWEELYGEANVLLRKAAPSVFLTA